VLTWVVRVEWFLCLWFEAKRTNDSEWLNDWLSEWGKCDCNGLTNWQSDLFKSSEREGAKLLLWSEMFTRFQVVNWFDFGHFCTLVCLQNFCFWQVAKISIETTNLYVYLPVPQSVGVIDGGRGRRGPFQPIIYAQLSSVWTADVCNASWISVLLFTSISLRLLLADNLFC